MPGWSAKFYETIDANGTKLRTLSDARDYVLALPEAEQIKTHWVTVAQALMLAAKSKDGPTMMAEIALKQALAGGRKDDVKQRAPAQDEGHQLTC